MFANFGCVCFSGRRCKFHDGVLCSEEGFHTASMMGPPIAMDPRTPHDVHETRKGEKASSWGIQRLRAIHLAYDASRNGVLGFAEFCTLVCSGVSWCSMHNCA